MLEKITIKKIESVFRHHDKIYILFSLNNSKFEFLYFTTNNYRIRSLLFGKDLISKVTLNREDKSITCIECSLCSKIDGGISFDDGSIVENDLTIEKCNLILKELKNNLIEYAEIIKFF
jgi:hypothetical protein